MGIPPYAGYSIGYRIVTDYLRQSGKSAVEATYIPWREIIADSPTSGNNNPKPMNEQQPLHAGKLRQAAAAFYHDS